MSLIAKPTARSLAIIAAVVFGIGAPIAQVLLPFGQDAEAFAREGEQTLRAADYAFSIWGVIYLLLAAYAIYAAWPRTPDKPLLRVVAWPSVFAIAACGAWIIAAALDWRLDTILIIASAALTLNLTLIHPRAIADTFGDRALVLTPLGMLAGWLTIATALNVLTVFTGWGWIDAESAPVWAGAALALVLAVGLTVFLRVGLSGYAFPIAWGLVAVYIAERDHRPIIALAALGGAILFVAALVVRHIVVPTQTAIAAAQSKTRAAS